MSSATVQHIALHTILYHKAQRFMWTKKVYDHLEMTALSGECKETVRSEQIIYMILTGAVTEMFLT